MYIYTRISSATIKRTGTFIIEDDHEAIIEPWIWECVQLEMERKK